jgi:FeS assembly SUF system regulator
MLRLSKLADYAVVVLTRLADGTGLADDERQPDGTVQTSPGIAVATGVPEPTVAKVLKALAGADLVASQRGARGGYRLLRPLHAIAVADVIRAIDGPIALTACVEGHSGTCDVRGMCAMRGRWNLVNEAIEQALGRITLADMRAASVPPLFRDDVPFTPLPSSPAALTTPVLNAPTLTMPALNMPAAE